MELPDRPLRAFAGEAEPGWPARVRWLVDLARALSASQRAGRVLGGVTADTVVVASDGTVRIVDAAPSDGADDRADQRAWGAIASELLAGSEDAPPDLKAVIARTREKDPQARFASMDAVVDAVARAVAAPSPDDAGPIPATASGGLKAHDWIFAAAVVLLLLGIATVALQSTAPRTTPARRPTPARAP